MLGTSANAPHWLIVRVEQCGVRMTIVMNGKNESVCQRLSKRSDLGRLMREFGCADGVIADYPINDPEARRRIGKLICGAMQDHARPYSVGIKKCQ